MVLKRKKGKLVYVCLKCGYEEPVSSLKLSTRQAGDSELLVISSEDKRKNASKTTLVSCPKCGYTPVLYIEMQTRSPDEPPTRFYKCPKCGYTRRESRVSLFSHLHSMYVVRNT